MMIDTPQTSQTTVEVRFRDLDAMGHVNNAVYFTYMEVARTRFFSDLSFLEDPLKLPVIIAEARCTFVAPATFADYIQIIVQVSRIGDKSFELLYEMSNQDHNPIANGRTVMVSYSYEGRHTIRIPDALRRALEAYHAL